MEKAYVVINCELGAEGAIIEEAKSIDCVKEAMGVFGNYDIILKLEGPNVDAISETIAKKIRKLEKVNCTTTLMCAN
ncbi:MAG: Lrp/AsnC family transcriptional regulator [Thaumarchaeota archaeon]|nr:Lrp/AsnC family transcriptional regulator [Nitrososphaerota archaeon]